MGKRRKNKNDGYVFSTNPDFEYEDEWDVKETLDPGEQHLIVRHDRKMRKGKTVTLVEGFVGDSEDLKELGKQLKAKCGVGGSAKDGEIILQGAFADKVVDLLKNIGYNVKKSGG